MQYGLGKINTTNYGGHILNLHVMFYYENNKIRSTKCKHNRSFNINMYTKYKASHVKLPFHFFFHFRALAFFNEE